MQVAKELGPITQFCFAMEIRVLEKHTLGNTDEPQGVEEKRQVLTSRDVSSLVIDNLCDQAEGGEATVACFYFDFAARNEQSPARVLGCLLKQLLFGLEQIPEEILLACKGRKGSHGGRGPPLSRILKMLQTTLSLKRAFICIDALDECVAEHRVNLLDSLNQLLQQSPGTRIFMTGRPHVLPEIRRRLAGRVAGLPIRTRRDDVIRYLRTRLAADTTPDAMDSGLEAEILKRIPGGVAEM